MTFLMKKFPIQFAVHFFDIKQRLSKKAVCVMLSAVLSLVGQTEGKHLYSPYETLRFPSG